MKNTNCASCYDFSIDKVIKVQSSKIPSWLLKHDYVKEFVMKAPNQLKKPSKYDTKVELDLGKQYAGKKVLYWGALPKTTSDPTISDAKKAYSNFQNNGVAKIDNKMNVVSIAEKPKRPLSNIAVTGLYFYDNDVVNIAHKIKPSNRGELEITSINQEYIKNKNLRLELLGRGTAWLDMGTYDNLLSASEFIQTIEKRQGLKIASLEEIAFYKKYISKREVMKIISNIKGSEYGDYLLSVVK